MYSLTFPVHVTLS